MSNKKTLAVTAFTLLLSQQSFASETEGFYFGGGYHGQFFNSMSELQAKGDKISVNDVGNLRTKGQFLSKYQPSYNPLFAANMAFGYERKLGNNSYRTELEGMYSSIKVDNIGLEGNRISISHLKDIGEGNNKKTYGYGIQVNNDKVENASVMANAYYYWKNDGLSFSPYVGAGVGATRMKMFETTSIRPAYQVKAGLGYSINESVNMHIGYRHFGVIGSNFDLTTQVLNQLNNDGSRVSQVFNKNHPASDNQTGSINIGSTLFATHGIEAGLTFHFASKV
ncbi:P44/Msp2 family outer membrane protein [Wolbachia endosymbiont of Brugia pahangi]|uniref:P44/Msp2 family outer membrane protein n=1 Tax=Wolbachia endosymbiont of Brugia pahangi TaxID=96495 RepID=UPI001435DE63|nr:P44/Msp2 family outer membrane protein [Wolbachia endosymbiont of Brugia pahangi]QIT35892.1 surface antigen family protein [Wolbachia endosymbiont of Brugia pahangi]